jgi:cation diffusion facilitator family transporter
MILIIGFELGKTSLQKIFAPEAVQFSWLTVVILVCSVAVKLWMGWFNGALAKRIKSEALRATAADCRSDAIATAAVLVGLALSRAFSVPLDGWVGVLVAILILKAGLESAKATLDPLLGQPADPEEVRAIEEFILAYEPIQGIHDLVIHDYGPGRRMMSVHAEVPESADIMTVHDVIDHVEREIKARFAMEAVIHMDPVQTGNPLVEQLRAAVAEQARLIHPELTIHDFRITAGPRFTNLIFDVVVPYEVKLDDRAVKEEMGARLAALDDSYRAVIEVDRTYVR